MSGKNILLMLGFVFCSNIWSTGITFTFANNEFTENDTYFEFDIMVAANTNGTLLGDTQAYINYAYDAFGFSVVNNGKLTLTKGEIVEGEFGSGLDLYSIISVLDNTSTRFAFNIDYSFDEPPLSFPDSANAISTSPVQLVHVKLEITDQDASTGISFQQNLMQGEQYDSSNNAYSPVVANDIMDTSLPITLNLFYTEFSDDQALIFWTTQSEINNLYWNLYRSVSLNPGQSIQINSAPIEGAGTSTQPTDYTYEDQGLQDYIYDNDIQGLNTFYYWLESVSYSGESIIFGPVALDLTYDQKLIPPHFSALTTSLGMNHPNPFNPITSIEFFIDDSDRGTLEIFNYMGERIVKRNYSAGYHVFNWDARKFPSGLYFYRLSTLGKYFQVRKMLLFK